MLRFLYHGASVTALISILVVITCLILPSIPAQLGFFRWLTSLEPAFVGMTPAFHHGIPWQYTWQQFESNVDLTGQTAIVTGANSGIGYHLALELAQVGASVTMVCRNQHKCQQAKLRMMLTHRHACGKLKTMIMDTASLASVRAFAEHYLQQQSRRNGKKNALPKIDMLFLNAGTAFFAPLGQQPKCAPKTKADQIDHLFQVNYLGHHLLYRLLEPFLANTARVVQTSSGVSFWTYSYRVATDLETLHGCSEHLFTWMGNNLSYGQSKLAQIVWVKALTRRLQASASSSQSQSQVRVNAFHPGFVNTPIVTKILNTAGLGNGSLLLSIVQHWTKHWCWKPRDGVLTGLYLAVNASHGIHGRYFHPMAQEVINPLSLDEKLQDDLWAFSDQLVQAYLTPPIIDIVGLTTSITSEGENRCEEADSMTCVADDEIGGARAENEGEGQDDGEETRVKRRRRRRLAARLLWRIRGRQRQRRRRTHQRFAGELITRRSLLERRVSRRKWHQRRRKRKGYASRRRRRRRRMRR